jgi:hypothetical protein
MIDIPKSKELIRGANLHRMHPGGELMTAIADQLAEAVKDANAGNDALRLAQADVLAAQRALADERASVRDITAAHAKFQAVLAVLRLIAEGAKSPKKLAHDALVTNGFADVPPAAAEQPAPASL